MLVKICKIIIYYSNFSDKMNHKNMIVFLKLNKTNDQIQLKKIATKIISKWERRKKNNLSSTGSPFLNPFELSFYLKLII
jgi:hypothetical protein